jgi:CheY-like chemotaxis protein
MGIKLLLADDSITIQKVIGIIFGGEEYSLTVVDNGKAAVEKARELSPDVLLIDALMPGMSGYEVCEAVRAIPSLAAKPILILTGSFEPFDEEKAKKCGADDYLAKPFESQQIVNKVKELAELGASRVVNEVPAQPVATPEPVPAFAPAMTPSAAPPQAAPETVPIAAPADIWGAFTPDAEPPAAPKTVQAPVEAGLPDALEPDVFAIVSEEADSQLIPSTPAPSTRSTYRHNGFG